MTSLWQINPNLVGLATFDRQEAGTIYALSAAKPSKIRLSGVDKKILTTGFIQKIYTP